MAEKNLLALYVYKMYTMYMSEYTVREFRDNIRKALNELDGGGTVTIRRYEKTYRLLSTDLKTVKKSGIEVVTLKNIPAERLAQGVCKIHGTPLDRRGKCLQKGCKYA